MIRTAVLVAYLFLGVYPAFADPAVGFQQVVERARKLAKQSYQGPTGKNLPDFLKNAGYDQWRDIRFKNDATLWDQDPQPFKLRFFHAGFQYKRPISVNYVDEKGSHSFVFSPALFDYGKTGFEGKVPVDAGFSGFRIHYPINTPKVLDEVGAFLGASYFRMVAKGLVYGLSARGIALNTAVPEGEEFPDFKEFWIVKPGPRTNHIKVYALLDSPSLTGAYEYTIMPGGQTQMRVRSVLFVRAPVQKLGLAPLTSMFFFGENAPASHPEFRPEVHDSDGLLIQTTGGEWIWRPLVDPRELQINTFEVNTPKGFGLLQRDMNFDHYQDLESRFDIRPSAWVVPEKDWGPGHVELVQLPSGNEYNDNINAFWVPKNPPKKGDVLKFSYTMFWGAATKRHSPDGYVVATRSMRLDKERAKFIVDFEGPKLAAIAADKALGARIDLPEGYRVSEYQVFKNSVTQGWRLVFILALDKDNAFKELLEGKQPAADMRAVINDGGKSLTETWTYTYAFDE